MKTHKLSAKDSKSDSRKIPRNSATGEFVAAKKTSARATKLTDKQKLYAEFEKEEQEYREAFADFDFEAAWNKPKAPEEIAEMALHQEAAKNFFKKDARVNFRIYQRDLDLLKRKAQKEGMPYQTLIGSVLHKFAHDEL